MAYKRLKACIHINTQSIRVREPDKQVRSLLPKRPGERNESFGFISLIGDYTPSWCFLLMNSLEFGYWVNRYVAFHMYLCDCFSN